MRSEMCKVIVERRRLGAKFRKRRPDPRDGEDDEHPLKISMRRDAQRLLGEGLFNDNLAPLRRYLRSQVGRPWNDVWSDICAHADQSSTVQDHLRQHARHFVEFRLRRIEGRLSFVSGEPARLGVDLYVDPDTGLLCYNDFSRQRKLRREELERAAEAARLARMRVISSSRQYHLLDDGAWWDVTLSRVPSGALVVSCYEPVWGHVVTDVVFAAGLSKMAPAKLYDASGVYASAKRQMSHKEMKQLCLR